MRRHLVLLLAPLLLLAGCVKFDTAMEIKDEDHIHVKATVGISKSMANMSGEDLTSQFSNCSDVKGMGGGASSAKGEKFEDDQYIGCTYSGDITAAEYNKKDDGSKITFDKDKVTFKMNAGYFNDAGGSTESLDASMLSDFKVSIIFPGKVLSNSGSRGSAPPVSATMVCRRGSGSSSRWQPWRSSGLSWLSCSRRRVRRRASRRTVMPRGRCNIRGNRRGNSLSRGTARPHSGAVNPTGAIPRHNSRPTRTRARVSQVSHGGTSRGMRPGLLGLISSRPQTLMTSGRTTDPTDWCRYLEGRFWHSRCLSANHGCTFVVGTLVVSVPTDLKHPRRRRSVALGARNPWRETTTQSVFSRKGS